MIGRLSAAASRRPSASSRRSTAAGDMIGPDGSGEWMTPNQAKTAASAEGRRGRPDPAVDEVGQGRPPEQARDDEPAGEDR